MVDAVDAEKVLAEGTNPRSLLDVWDTMTEREMFQRALALALARGDEEAARVCQSALDRLPRVTAVEALRANALLVQLMSGWRWIAMRQAREEGASWADIGAALGISEQEARDSYRHAIEAQEEHLGDLHDRQRARAVL